MGKYSKRRKADQNGRNRYEHFIKITSNLYDSAAFADLSNGAARCYLEVRRRYNGQNNGEISLSCREAAEVAKCSKNSAGKYFKELVEHGFLKVSEKGLFTYRNATTWILTNEPYKDKPPTNEWKSWKLI